MLYSSYRQNRMNELQYTQEQTVANTKPQTM